MGLFDLFKKKNPDDGTYHRDRSADGADWYDGGAAYSDSGVFRLTVQDVFTITGRGTVVTGKVDSGSISVNDIVTLRRQDGSAREVAVAGIEMFRKLLDTAQQGDNVGLLLRGLARSEVGRGDLLEKL